MLKQIRYSNTLSAQDFSRRRVMIAFAALLFAAPMLFGNLPGAQAADSLDGPRSAGTVGERYDGYAVVRDGAEGDVQQLVASINAKRKEFYQSKATEQGVDITAIQAIYAKAIYDKAPSGWWFLTESGWVQK
ncbi:MAG: YdbL family protein [Alphaproteobacteria bacterium]|nr:YdbL family protein [Alphaproteobacteria bacterium]